MSRVDLANLVELLERSQVQIVGHFPLHNPVTQFSRQQDAGECLGAGNVVAELGDIRKALIFGGQHFLFVDTIGPQDAAFGLFFNAIQNAIQRRTESFAVDVLIGAEVYVERLQSQMGQRAVVEFDHLSIRVVRVLQFTRARSKCGRTAAETDVEFQFVSFQIEDFLEQLADRVLSGGKIHQLSVQIHVE